MPITWDEATPRDSDLRTRFPSEVTGLKANFALGIATSVEWPGSGGGSIASAGAMKLGTLKSYVGATSALSRVGNDGHLFLDSTTTRLYHANSSVTSVYLGGVVLEMPVSVGTTARWVLSAGSIPATSAVSFPVLYGAPPMVLLSVVSQRAAVFGYGVAMTAPTTTGFVASTYTIPDEVTGWVASRASWINWMSLGTVSF